MSRDEGTTAAPSRSARPLLRKSLLAAFIAVAAAGGVWLAPPAQVEAQGISVSVSAFHERLADHGRWFEHPRYGWVWFPTSVDRDWRPYTRGQWVWTEQFGWYWSSDEPFGWATYHYGRWAYDEVYGWVWVPGNTWGPAWVAFRYGEAQVGWAPLPPETLSVSVGFDIGATDMTASYYQPRWVFVPRKHFLDRRLQTHASPWAQNNLYLRQTTNVTNYTLVNNVVVNRSIDPQRISSATGRRIVPVRIRDVDDARKTARRSDREIDVYRPAVREAAGAAPPSAARATPTDRPRYAVHRDASAPSERRAVSDEQRATTPAAPTRVDPDDRRRGRQAPAATAPRGAPDERRRSAQPAGTPRLESGDGRDSSTPSATPRQEPGERRRATPAQPAAAPRAVPEEPRAARPVPPDATPRVEPDRRRRAVPAQPAAAPTIAPEEPRRATPMAPDVTPRGEPDQRRRSAPPQPAAAPPPTTGEPRRPMTPQPAAAPRPTGEERPSARPAPPPAPQVDQGDRRGPPPAQVGDRPAQDGGQRRSGDDDGRQRDRNTR